MSRGGRARRVVHRLAPVREFAGDAARYLAPRCLQDQHRADAAEVRFTGRVAVVAGALAERLDRAHGRWWDRWVIAGRVRENELGVPETHPDRAFPTWRYGGPHLTWEPCNCHEHECEGDDGGDPAAY